jgi:hypothetical protein
MANDPQNPNSNALGPKVSSASLPKNLLSIIALVRAKMRDFPELNRLIEGRETSDREIAFALMECIDDFNMTPPLLGTFTIDSFPSISLLINGSVINILSSVGLLQTRNHMSYSDGQGIQVSVSDKGPQLMNWMNLFTQNYEQKKFRLKQAINLGNALNGSAVSSEYALINGYFSDLK